MKTIDAKLLFTALLVCMLGLWCLKPGQAFPTASPQETLAGLTPGISTLADASRIYGVYDTMLPGDFTQYVGGPRATKAYRWVAGYQLGRVPGLILETNYGSPTINLIVVDGYPGLGTSRGLTTLVPEQRVLDIYGLPDYAYELSFGTYYTPVMFRELYYVNQGLLVVLGQVDGRPNWTVVKLFLTYPTYLRNGVAIRNRYAMYSSSFVEDISYDYYAQARTAYTIPY